MGGVVSRVALAHPSRGLYDISAALGVAFPALLRESGQPKKDFGALVRERRRQRGLPRPVAEKVLPFRAAGVTQQTRQGVLVDHTDGHAVPSLGDSSDPNQEFSQEPSADAPQEMWENWRWRLAERRMDEADQAFQEAVRAGVPRHALTRFEAEATRTAEAYVAALIRFESPESFDTYEVDW